MTTNKMTKKEVINMMLNDEAVKANATYVAYLANELALIVRKASSKKPTQKQEANEALKDLILAVLAEATEPMTITQIQEADAELKVLSNQKVSSLVRQLYEVNKVTRNTFKRTAVFSLAEEEDAEDEE